MKLKNLPIPEKLHTHLLECYYNGLIDYIITPSYAEIRVPLEHFQKDPNTALKLKIKDSIQNYYGVNPECIALNFNRITIHREKVYDYENHKNSI